MKRFLFPLRPVEVLRLHRDLKARQALAAALRLQAESATRLESALARAEQSAVAITLARRRPTLGREQVGLSAWHRRECAAAAEEEGRLAQAGAEVVRRRDDWIEARRQLRAVERLEEKARARHALACLAQEQREIDDFAGLRALKMKFRI